MRKVIRTRLRKDTGGVDAVVDVSVVVAVNRDGAARTTASTGQRAASPSTPGPESHSAPEQEEHMPEKEQEPQHRKVTKEELEQLGGEELPERAAMSLVNANVAIPINAAVAANVLSDDAVAYADATQDSIIDQSN